MNLMPFTRLLPRLIMFAVMLGLIVFTTQVVSSVPYEKTPGAIVVNPIIQTGLLLLLVFLGSLIGFWITFGDLVNRAGKK